MRLKDLDTWQMRRSASAEAKKEELRKCFNKSDTTPVSDRGAPFTYIDYWLPRDAEVYWDYHYMRTMIRNVGGTFEKRYFSSYAKAIAQLTKVKLNIIEADDYPWRSRIACAIVEGYLNYKGKEIVVKRTELPNERNSEEGRLLGRRLERERRVKDRAKQRRGGFSIPKGLGSTTPTVTSTSPVWSGGTATSSSTATTLDWIGDEIQRLSNELWRYTYSPD